VSRPSAIRLARAHTGRIPDPPDPHEGDQHGGSASRGRSPRGRAVPRLPAGRDAQLRGGEYLMAKIHRSGVAQTAAEARKRHKRSCRSAPRPGL
jgi:hypothetical protein